MRIDFYTQIHKALRHCLFTLSMQIGSSDYTQLNTCQRNHEDLMRLSILLKVHAAHEEEFFHPLIAKKLNQVNTLTHEHQNQESELITLEQLSAAIISLSDEQEMVHQGLHLYRKLNSFIAVYLHHLDEEEALMPMIQQSFSMTELMQALNALFINFTQQEIFDSIRYMLPALNLQEQTNMVLNLITNTEEKTRNYILQLAKNSLPATGWMILSRNLSDLEVEIF